MEWHVDLQFPLADTEARYKLHLYPPPEGGLYYTPWLWVDGHNRGSTYTSWASYVSSALTVPANMIANVSGTYDPMDRTGRVQVEIINDDSLPVTASAYVVITEDSCYYVGPNGDPWHNHVCRDFVPNEYGTTITVAGAATDTFTQDFALRPTWNEDRCNVVFFLQDSAPAADSSRGCYAAGQIPVMQLTGVSEKRSRPQMLPVSVRPNPARDHVELSFSPRAVIPYHLRIYALDGTLIHETAGRTNMGENRIIWSGSDRLGRHVPAGVYLWRLTTGTDSHSGRVTLTN
jgi:hypothetical protein